MTDNLNNNHRLFYRVAALVALIIALTISSQTRAATGTCNGASITLPFTDVPVSNIQLGGSPAELLFDGANLWVSNPSSDSISVIRAVGSLRGTVLETITGNGLDTPRGMAFDGERVLVTNNILLGSVSPFKAADFSPLGNVFAGVNSAPFAACSDGLNFWITRAGLDDVVRY